MSRILILLPTTSYRASAFVQAGQTERIDIVIGSERKQALADLVPGRTLALDLKDTKRAVEQIRKHNTHFPVAAIIGVDEETVVLAAMACEVLGLPHNPVAAVQATRDKYKMRQKFAEAGLPSPQALLIPVESDPKSAAQDVEYPCVLKPTYLSASRGVIRVNNEAEFQTAFATVRNLLSETADLGPSSESARYILAEDYIPGEEVAIDGILHQGRLLTLAVFDKPDPLEGPYFPETTYVTPSRLPPPTQRSISDAVEAGTRAMGLVTGPIHAECRLNKQGVFLLEIAARSIGGYCSKVLRFGPDLSLEALILKHALGADIAVYSREKRAAGVMMIPPERAGVLRHIGGKDIAEKIPGVAEIIMAIPLGHKVEVLPTASRYLGFIFAKGDTPTQVQRALERSHAALEIIIEDE